MRGRKGDPQSQAAKGFPGKRRSRVEKLLDDGRARAEAMASAATESNDPLAPPAFLGPEFGAAIRIWREYAPQLQRMRSMHALDRLAFAQLCIAYDMYLEATTNMSRPNGKVRLVKTVSGDKMERVSPWVTIQTIAYRQCQELFSQFGMRPIDRAKLFHDRQALAAGLWSQALPDEDVVQPTSSSARQSDVGAMDMFDSAPPETIN